MAHYTMTKDQLATALDLTPEEAYTLLRFGESRGFVKQVGTMPAPRGKKGRGPTLYRVDKEFPHHMYQLWSAAEQAGRLEAYGEDPTP